MGVEAHAGRDLGQHRHAVVGVVAAPALADVVQQAGQHQQVRPPDPARQRPGLHGGLPQVPVHGEAVVGVALRLAAHQRPLGEVPLPDALLVERLQQQQRGRTGEQQVDERGAGGRRPRRGRRRRLGGQAGQRAPVELGGVVGGDRRRLQRHRGVAGHVDVVAHVDLAVPQRQAAAQRPFPAGPAQRAGQRALDAGPGVVARPRDRAGGVGDGPHQQVGVRVAERGRHRVLLLERQPVAGPPRAPVQLDAGAEQGRVRVVEGAVVVVPQDRAGGLGPGQGVDVTHAAPALLEVGLQQERHLAGPQVALTDPGGQGGQPALGPLVPLELGPAGQLVGQRPVAGQVAGLEQAGRRVEVVGRQGQRLLRGAHGVAELQPGVPDRVPEAVGQLADVGPAAVQQQHVDVRLERQLAPAVAAHGHQGDAPGLSALDGHREQLVQPAVDLAGPHLAQIAADQRVVRGELRPGVEDGHRWARG